MKLFFWRAPCFVHRNNSTLQERLHQGSIIINGSPVDIAKHWLDSTNIVMFNGKNIRPLLKSMCITDEHCMFKFLKLKLSNTIDYKEHKFPLIIFGYPCSWFLMAHLDPKTGEG